MKPFFGTNLWNAIFGSVDQQTVPVLQRADIDQHEVILIILVAVFGFEVEDELLLRVDLVEVELCCVEGLIEVEHGLGKDVLLFTSVNIHKR